MWGLTQNFYRVLHSFLVTIVLEERAVYYRETKNGLYSTLPFVLSNTLVNVPFLLFCTVLFSLICYWAIVRSLSLDQLMKLKLVSHHRVYIQVRRPFSASSHFCSCRFLPRRAKPSSSHRYCPSSWPPSRLVLCKFLSLTRCPAKSNASYSLNGFWMSVGGYLYVQVMPLDWVMNSSVVQHKSTLASEILVLQLPLYGLSEIRLWAPFERESYIFSSHQGSVANFRVLVGPARYYLHLRHNRE